MKLKVKTVFACVVCLLLCGALFAQNATAPKIIGFSTMAATIEKNYGQLLELDLEMKNGAAMYTAKVIMNGMKVTLYLNAENGTETGRRPPDYLDYEDAAVYGYSLGNPSAAMPAQPYSSATPAAPVQGGAAGQPAISADKAKEIALARAGGGMVAKIELDYEHGRLVYDMKVYTGNIEYEVYVDAQTGDILKFKRD